MKKPSAILRTAWCLNVFANLCFVTMHFAQTELQAQFNPPCPANADQVATESEKPTEPGLLASKSGGNPSVDYELFTSTEFRFIARLPKNVSETRTKHMLGIIGSFKALDASRLCTIGVSVNKIEPFIKAAQRGQTGWEEKALNSFFKNYINSYPGIADSSVKSAKIEWLGCSAIEYSFSCQGNLGDNVDSFHSGLFFLEKGSFFNINVSSLTSGLESKSSLSDLMKGFALLDVK
jgi:hypothetical protein